MKSTNSTKKLALLLRTMAALYPLDKTKPGIVLAYLPDKLQFYGSLCRYEDDASRTYPPGRQVLAQAYCDTVDATINQLCALWHQNTTVAREFMAATKPVVKPVRKLRRYKRKK